MKEKLFYLYVFMHDVIFLYCYFAALNNVPPLTSQEKKTKNLQINLQLPTLQVAELNVITRQNLNECNWEKAYSMLDNE